MTAATVDKDRSSSILWQTLYLTEMIVRLVLSLIVCLVVGTLTFLMWVRGVTALRKWIIHQVLVRLIPGRA